MERGNGGGELSVFAAMGGSREVVDNHVRGEPAALDDPAFARNEGTVFGGADDALVDQVVIERSQIPPPQVRVPMIVPRPR